MKKLSKKGHAQAIITAVLPGLEMVLRPLMANQPHWQIIFNQAIILYAFRMAYKQEVINEFVSFVMDNPSVFRKEIIESDEFKNGFVIFF